MAGENYLKKEDLEVDGWYLMGEGLPSLALSEARVGFAGWAVEERKHPPSNILSCRSPGNLVAYFPQKSPPVSW